MLFFYLNSNRELITLTYNKEEYWSKFAYIYDENQKYVVGEAILKSIIGRLSQESGLGTLIEFGCGAGFFTKALAKNARRVIATDLSDELLEIAEKQLREYQNVIVEKADCENSKYPEGEFDTVVMANLVHVIQHPLMAIQESHRILKDGGLLLVISFTTYTMNWFERLKMGIRFLRTWGKPPRFSRELSPDYLCSMVESAGFQVEEVQLMGDKVKALYLKGRKR
jgi:ubiquinone/menaquinone biosynthesis C-methylase UbiE